ncbi:MAG: dimeric alpha+beta barrel [Polyangiaceae bacterium]|jgi:hypothetical protein
MKVLALIDVARGADIGMVRARIEEELRASWELYKTGVLREVYATATPTRVVFVLEAGSVAEAHSHLSEMPLVKAGLLAIELIELKAFTNWSLLFKE